MACRQTESSGAFHLSHHSRRGWEKAGALRKAGRLAAGSPKFLGFVIELEIFIEGERNVFQPGDSLQGKVRIKPERSGECSRLAIAAGWRAHSPDAPEESVEDLDPDEADIAQRVDLHEGTLEAGRAREFPFAFKVPSGPFSYQGQGFVLDWILEASAALDEGTAKARVPYRVEPGGFHGRPRGLEDEVGGKEEKLDLAPSGCVYFLGIPILLLSAGWTAVSVWVFAQGLKARESILWPALMISMGTLLTGALAWAVSRGLRSNRAARRFKRGRMRFSNRRPRPGETLTVSLEIVTGEEIEQLEIRSTLSCEETFYPATEAPNSNKTIVSESQSHAFGRAHPGMPLAKELSWRIPDKAPYSLAAAEAEVIWMLDLFIDADGENALEEYYNLEVIP